VCSARRCPSARGRLNSQAIPTPPTEQRVPQCGKAIHTPTFRILSDRASPVIAVALRLAWDCDGAHDPCTLTSLRTQLVWDRADADPGPGRSRRRWGRTEEKTKKGTDGRGRRKRESDEDIPTIWRSLLGLAWHFLTAWWACSGCCRCHGVGGGGAPDGAEQVEGADNTGDDAAAGDPVGLAGERLVEEVRGDVAIGGVLVCKQRHQGRDALRAAEAKEIGSHGRERG